VDYVGYLGHVEDLIATVPTKVTEEPTAKVTKENGDSHLHSKEVDEKDKWVLVAKQSGRESKAIMKKAAKKKM